MVTYGHVSLNPNLTIINICAKYKITIPLHYKDRDLKLMIKWDRKIGRRMRLKWDGKTDRRTGTVVPISPE